MGIRNMIARAGGKAADKVAKLASLSPEQLLEIEELKDAYLSEAPDPTDEAAQEMTSRLLASAGIEIYNAYLPQIKQLYLPLDNTAEFDGKQFKASYNIRYFKITKWVTDTKENSIEKLVNVYATLSNEDCNIALIFHRSCDKTDTYLAITNTKNSDSNNDADIFQQRLTDALRGNFPGAEWEKPKKGMIPFLNNEDVYSVASASNIPTEKSEKFISQTIEKLLDGNVPEISGKEYTLILLATPVRDVEERKLRLAELYSGLAPYAGWQTNFRFTEANATNSSATFGVNAGVSAGIQRGQNQSVTDSHGVTDSESQTITDSTNQSTTESTGNTITDSTSQSQAHSSGTTETSGTSHTNGTNSSDSITGGVSYSNTGSASVSAGVPGVGSATASSSQTVGVSASTGHSSGVSSSDTTSSSVAKNIVDCLTDTAGRSVSNSLTNAVTNGTGRAVANALGKAVTNTIAKTAGAYKGVNFGGNFGANFARSSNITVTVGKDEGITQTYTNYTIKHTLQILEEQMKRYEESVALGMWDFAAYVLSTDINTVNNAAHSYLALTQGEKSYLSQASVNLWRGDVSEEKDAAREICSYLKQFRHPIFGINPLITEKDNTFFTYPSTITATTSLSGKELAYSLNFPQKSIVGLPVLQCAEFGRNVISYGNTASDKEFFVGHIFHMNHEEKTSVSLNSNSLTGHTFITGSTGSGKSNTVYQILSSAMKQDVNFLVIEPAKGEYKNVFGGLDSVSIYGTNPKRTPLLKINPFSFPDDIHVLEHLDRLVEIFNVCWPMYAAMPAVLKNAIEKSYEDCGWDLTRSENEYGNDLYPSFADVARNVKIIIDSSEYDTENKGAYKGSLLTRLQSLTNGINGLIFTGDEIDSKDLFDKNVIVDLSRVGSSETKSLLMGMLVLKLQEYRISSTDSFNNSLKHLTVLEEAHNLLKRTSTDHSVESGNLLGKSVEMLANAIAEMRTYGEGFIIADQSPGLLDMSVIRNTNTKIIMRLPDEMDRQIVGKAANLNDDQITELSKLPLGVGAIYQNDWVQPVLCKINHYHYSDSKYINREDTEKNEYDSHSEKVEIAELLSNGTQLKREIVLHDIKQKLSTLGLSSYSKVAIMRTFIDPPREPRMTKLAPIFAELFPETVDLIQDVTVKTNDELIWTEALRNQIQSQYSKLGEQTVRDIIQGTMTYYFLIMHNDLNRLHDWSVRGGLS